MTHFASSTELEEELTAFVARFFAARADGQASGLPRVLLRTLDPAAVLTIDFGRGVVERGEVGDSDVVLDVDADALHDVLLDRVDPVQLSRLYETGRVRFSGAPADLSALIVLATPLGAAYAESLRDRGREELLATAPPPAAAVWGDAPEDRVPPPLLRRRRPWQRAAPSGEPA